MDIEEAIKQFKSWIEYEKNNKLKIKEADKLIEIQETILSAYEEEKEKNKILLQCLKDSQERCENEHLFLGNPDMLGGNK